MSEPGDITRLLQEADQGKPDAANQLYVLVEEDLRRIARKRKRVANVPAAVDASTTILVDEAFVRLVGKDDTTWQAGDRKKFFAYVSSKMHDYLIDELRKHLAAKRGGGEGRAPLEGDVPDAAAPLGHLELLVDLKDALLRLQKFALDDSVLFRLRFFLDCTFEESKEIMGLSSKTEAVRSYQRTQLWLRRELKDYNPSDDDGKE